MQNISDAQALRKAVLDRFDALLTHAENLSRDPDKLADIDALVREQMLVLGDEVVAHVVQQAAPRLRAEQALPPCPKCAKPLSFKQYRKTQLRTALTGQVVTVRAPLAVCQDCGTTLNLVRRALRLDADGRTPRLRHLAAIAGTIEPYEAAACQVLSELAGITLSANGVHGICQEVGALAAERMARGDLGRARPLEAGEVLYVMADGCMVWVDDGWHKVKFAVLFPSSDNPQVSSGRHETTHRRVVATLADRDELGRMVWHAARCFLPPDGHGGVRTRNRIIFISDGSAWLRNMVDEHVPGAFVLLDWYHMAEHLAAAASLLHPDDVPAATAWRKTLEAQLMEGRIEAVLGGIQLRAVDPTLSPTTRKGLEDLHAYLHKRRDTLKYCQARQRGWLIGSGPAESAANHVIQQRMKRAGMRWTADGAMTMLALRSAWRSHGGFERWTV